MLNELSQAAYLLLLLIFVPIPFAADRAVRSRPWVTYTLIAANVALFFFWVFPAAGTVGQSQIFATWGVIPKVPGFLPLFTSLFIHVSPTHLIWNMAFLWIFGPNCEDALGHLAYGAFYIAGGVVAGLLHTAIVQLFAPNFAVAYAPLVGASGAISALVGMYAIRFYRSKLRLLWVCASFLKLSAATFEIPAVTGLSLWFLQNLYGAVFSLFQPDRNGIAYWAHIGGVIFGMTVAEVTGMLGDGTREYLFSDAVAALELGESRVLEAVSKFQLLLQHHPDDAVVRDSLTDLLAQLDDQDSELAREAAGEAVAALFESSIKTPEDNRLNDWQHLFDKITAEKIVGKSSLLNLAQTAASHGMTALAQRLYLALSERFPKTKEAQHADLELAALCLLDENMPLVQYDVLLSRIRLCIQPTESRNSITS